MTQYTDIYAHTHTHTPIPDNNGIGLAREAINVFNAQLIDFVIDVQAANVGPAAFTNAFSTRGKKKKKHSRKIINVKKKIKERCNTQTKEKERKN